MIGIGSNKKIIDIYNEIKAENLILQPNFQRKLVWSKVHKESFIETILLGLPFPEIYTAVGDINLKARKTEVLVVDGQQRLSTIYEYIEDVDDAFEYKKIKRFGELSDDEQKAFFYYVVVVRDLGNITLYEIKQIFRRINSVDYALESMEINNALYDGEYISTAKVILDEINLYSTFKEVEISRMKDLEFILALMVTNDLNGYFTGYKEVESFVKNYNDEYPQKQETIDKFTKVNNLLKAIKLEEDSIWINSRSCYFTLVVELLKKIECFDIKNDNVIHEIEEKLKYLSEEIVNNKKLQSSNTNEYSEFYKAMYQGTGSRRNRITRGALLETHLNSIVDSVK